MVDGYIKLIEYMTASATNFFSVTLITIMIAVGLLIFLSTAFEIWHKQRLQSLHSYMNAGEKLLKSMKKDE